MLAFFHGLLFFVIPTFRDALAVQEVWLTALQPFTGGAWDGGVSMRFAGEIMLEEINANPDLLPGYTLKIVWQDGRCDGDIATEQFLESLLLRSYKAFAPSTPVEDLDADGDGILETEDTESMIEQWNSSRVHPDPIGVLIGCSAPAISIANIAASVHLPLVSNIATRVSLSDRTQFPHFFRTIMPDTVFNAAWVALARMLNQSSVVPVIGGGSMGSMGAKLAEDAQAQGVELAGNDLTETVAANFYGVEILKNEPILARQAAQDLYSLKRRIVILLIFDALARLLLCEAYKRGFHNAIYMTFGWLPYGWWAGSDTTCTPQQLTGMATYFVSADAVKFRRDDHVRLSCSAAMTSGQLQREWYRRQGAPVGDLSRRPEGFFLATESATTADAICMYAQMLHEVLVARGLPLSSLAARTPETYGLVQDLFARTDFEGCQGRVRFPPGSGDPSGSVILQQLQEGGVLVDIAAYNHPRFNFLGKANLTFHFPGEVVFAGPAGAESISASVVRFRECSGGQIANLRNNTCESCAESMEFSEFAGMCMCTAGHFQSGGACLDCPGGKFSNAAGALQCTDCEPGTSSRPSSPACTYCPRSSFAAARGQAACTSCPAMYTTRDIASSDPSDCVCDFGAFAGSDGCQACPDGANTTSIGSVGVSQCRCREGHFMSRDFSRCEPCPSGSTTRGEGKTSIASCLCERDTYMPLPPAGCRPCPKGMTCPRGSNEANAQYLHLEEIAEDQQFLELQPQHWASLAEPMSVFQCRQAAKCPGGRPGSCAPLLEGLLCERCAAGYRWSGQACTACNGSKFALLSLVPLMPMVILISYGVSGERARAWASWKNGVMTAVFVTLYHYQTASTVYSYDIIRLPQVLRDVSGFWLFTNDPSALLPMECLGVGFTSMMILKAVAPLAVAGLCAAIYFSSVLVARCSKKKAWTLERDRVFHVCGSILFTFFSAIAMVSLSIFKCVSHPNGLKTLALDMSVICFESDEWKSGLGIGIACVLLYILGLGSVFLQALLIAPACFSDPGFQMRWKFLFIKFHSTAYWWSLVLPLKTVLINMTFAVATDGQWQLNLALGITMLYLGGAIAVMPFRWSVLNFAHIVEGMTILYSGSTLLTYVDANSAPSASTNAIALAVECVPIIVFVGAAAYLFRNGRRALPEPAEVDQMKLVFRELQEVVEVLTDLDEDTGTDMLQTMDFWERQHISAVNNVIRVRLLGRHSKTTVVDRSLSYPISQKASMEKCAKPTLYTHFGGPIISVGAAQTACI